MPTTTFYLIITRDGPDTLSGRLSGRISGGKIGRIAGYRFSIIITLSKVKGKYAELVKFLINFKMFKGKSN